VRALTGGTDYDARLQVMEESRSRWINDKIRASLDAACELFGFEAEFLGTPPIEQPPLYVTFATPNYATRLRYLRQSTDRFGLELHAEIVQPVGEWVENCAFKPTFMQRMRKQFAGRRLVWLDADSVVMQPPELFDRLPKELDAAVAARGDEIMSNAVYFAANGRTPQLIDDWVAEQARNPREWDQKVLARVLERGGYKFEKLPPEYSYLNGISQKEHPDVEPVLLQLQASREENR
jgi:hypothetical protein